MSTGTKEFISGGAPGITAEEMNGAFWVETAVYNGGTGHIDVTIGPGRANFSTQSVFLEVEFLTPQVMSITTPALSTTYYVFLKSDGSMVWNTTGIPAAGCILLASLVVGGSFASITRHDKRGAIPTSQSSVSTDASLLRAIASPANAGTAGDPAPMDHRHPVAAGVLVVGLNADTLHGIAPGAFVGAPSGVTRLWVQVADPGGAAADGDVWIAG